MIANSSNQKDFFLQNIKLKFLIKIGIAKKNKKNNFFRNFLYLSKLSKTPIKEDSLLSGN